MNVYINMAPNVQEAIKQSLDLFKLDINYTGPSEAEVMILENKLQLYSLSTKSSKAKKFVLLSEDEPEYLPENAVWIPISKAITQLSEELSDM